MAYYDESGKITIDEVAAQADIRRIESAIASLNNSKKAINNLIQQATSEQGQTSAAIIEKASEMKNQIDAMIGHLSETASFISRTVSHYQWVDQKIKEAVNASQFAEITKKPATTEGSNMSGYKMGTAVKRMVEDFKKNGGKK